MLSTDLRYAFRKLIQSPGFLAVAVISLALGIGANTAIFTLVDKVLLKMLPVENPQELHMVMSGTRERPRSGWNYPDYAGFRDHVKAFQGMIAYTGGSAYGFRYENDAATTLALGAFVSGNYFGTLRVPPAIGRVLTPEDDRASGAGPYIVLSHRFWRGRFREDPQVLGKRVTINNAPMTIVGVAREGFTGIEVGGSPDFFMPIMMRTPVTGNPNWNNRNHWWLTVAGRLPASVNPRSLEPQLTGVTHQNADGEIKGGKDPKFVNKGQDVILIPGSQGYSFLRNRLAQPLKILMGVVGLLLLIACANVANLLLARAAGREREIAVRLAIGASRGDIVRGMLAESLLLAAFGGVAGLVVAHFGVQLLASFLPNAGYSTVWLDLAPDWRVLLFTLGVSLVTGLLFGLTPVLQANRGDFVPALKEDSGASTASRGRFLLRRGLVVLQVAVSLLLLIGAGLFARSLGKLRAIDLGFEPTRVAIIETDPGRHGYNGQRAREYYERLIERVRAIPGVRSAALANITPLSGSRWNNDVSVEGYPYKERERRVVDHNNAGPGFFETVGIPIVLGRDFRPQDNPVKALERPQGFRTGVDPAELEGPRVAIVNQAFVKKYFGDENPLGRRFSRSERYAPEGAYEIVGVVRNAKYFGLRNEAEEPLVYLPEWRTWATGRTLVLRTTGDPARVLDGVRREAQTLDASIPILRTRMMQEHVDSNILQERFLATLCSLFGLLALLLAGVGLYGVVANAVTRRTREIGIRMALGARQGKVLRMVLTEAAVLLLLGSAIAIPAALATTHIAKSILFGVEPNDALSIGLATAVLLAIGVLAAFLPAHRASRIDPLRALRHQ